MVILRSSPYKKVFLEQQKTNKANKPSEKGTISGGKRGKDNKNLHLQGRGSGVNSTGDEDEEFLYCNDLYSNSADG